MRWLHVLAATVIVGGAALCWALAVRGRSAELPGQASALGFAAERYEWAFWIALGVIVATGVGNLGAYGEALPGPGTAWGRALALKLGGVTLLIVGSVVRTVAVVRAASEEDGMSFATMRHLYAATVLVAAGVVGLAEYLAHG
ncbi:MAG: CopD family protein [Dehalococcoidia bacterium]